MSIKIYNAYRIHRSVNLGELIVKMQKRCTELALEVLRNQLDHWMNFTSVDGEYYKHGLERAQTNWPSLDPKDQDRLARHIAATKAMEEGFTESSTKGLRSPFDYEASVTFRYLDGIWYMQVYADGPLRDIFKEFVDTPRIRDFHYQNSTDRDEGISESGWRARRKVWDKLYEKDIDRKTFLSLEIMSLSEFNTWLFREKWEFMDELRKKLPTSEQDR